MPRARVRRHHAHVFEDPAERAEEPQISARRHDAHEARGAENAAHRVVGVPAQRLPVGERQGAQDGLVLRASEQVEGFAGVNSDALTDQLVGGTPGAILDALRAEDNGARPWLFEC